MSRLYEAEAYAPAHPRSWWLDSLGGVTSLPHLPPPDGSAQCDVAVVGAGHTGLNAALTLAEDHGADVIVLDARGPAWGASARNGGFACLGGAKLGDLTIARRFGAEVAREWVAAQVAAVDLVAENLKRYGIDAERQGAGEICIAAGARSFARMRVEAQEAAAILGKPAEVIPAEALAERGLGMHGGHGAVRTPHGFGLNPARHVLGLVGAARNAGVRIHANSEVISARPGSGHWHLTVRGPERCCVEIRARRVISATNGYGSDGLLPGLGPVILPVLSTILVTRPLRDAEVAAQGWSCPDMAYDSRTLLHYFRRLPDGRFLFGMRGGLSASSRGQARIRAAARRHFRRLFPAWAGVEVTHEWSGLACLCADRRPFAGPVPGAEGLFATYGYHGNGVAMGSLAGRWLGALAAGRPDPRPALMRHPPRPFPLPRLRRAMLAGAYLGAGIGDALG